MIFIRYSKSCKKLENFRAELIEKNIEEICKYFQALEKARILLFFTRMKYISINGYSRPAEFYPLDLLDMAIKHQFLKKEINKYPELDFAVLLTKETLLDEMARIIVLSHELQHAVQYIENKKIYLYGCILRDFDNIPRENVPTEKDAEWKAKFIVYKLFDKTEVDEFINKKVTSEDIGIQIWGHNFRSISLKIPYSLESETLKLWEDKRMEEKIQKLKSRPHHDSFQKDIIRMYDYADL